MDIIKKHKIGLITCHRTPNYGSFLQAWCTVEYFKRLGQDIEIIDYLYPNLYHLESVYNNEIKRNKNNCGIITRVKRYIIDRWYVCNSKRGLEYPIYVLLNRLFFHNHNKLYFKELTLSRKTYLSINAIQRAKLNYDILLSGSDQIWNPRFSGHDGTFFLQFGNKGSKRVAYSSSFGVKSLIDPFEKEYAIWLKNFSHIATREESGRKIASRLSGKNCVHVLDPVMLFNREFWVKAIKKSTYTQPKPKGYVVTYCLDYVYNGIIDYADNVMKKIAEHHNLLCATLYKSNIRDKEILRISNNVHPFEFVNTLLHADFALISSFHGLAFCILFHTPFLVIIDNKKNNDARLIDLLETFGLNDRILTLGETINVTQLNTINWRNVDQIYARMHNQSTEYIRQVINN